MLTSQYPFPPHSGGKIRIAKIVEGLLSEYSVSLIVVESVATRRYPADEEPPPKSLEVVRYTLGTSSLPGALVRFLLGSSGQGALYGSAGAVRFVREQVRDKDLVVVHLARLFPLVAGFHQRIVCELTDVLSINYSRMAADSGSGLRGVLTSLFWRIEAKRMRRLEESIIEQAAASVVVNVDELATRLRPNVEHIPIGCTPDAHPIELPAGSREILFIGKLDYPPNADAIEFLLSEVLPRMRHRVTLRLVGSVGERLGTRLSTVPNVTVTGAVGSLAEASRGCICAVAPMRLGSGMQNKVLDYAVLGIPAVVSPMAAAGYSESFAQLLQIDEPVGLRWSAALDKLIDDPLPRWEAAQAVRHAAIDSYAWPSIQQRYRAVLYRCLAAAP